MKIFGFNKKIKQESPDNVGRGMGLFILSDGHLVYWLRMYFSTTSLLMFPSVLM